LTSPLPATALSTLNTLTLQLPSNVEKEAEAKKEITKLLLFHICGKLSVVSTSFGNLSYPKPAQGMKIILDSAQPARATGFSDLIRNTCATAEKLDLMNIRSRLISIVFINMTQSSYRKVGVCFKRVGDIEVVKRSVKSYVTILSC
jgi:hypothetical protein